MEPYLQEQKPAPAATIDKGEGVIRSLKSWPKRKSIKREERDTKEWRVAEFNCSTARGPCRRGSRSPWEWCGPCRCCTTFECGSYRNGCRSVPPPASWGRRWYHPRCTWPGPSSRADRWVQPQSSSHVFQTLSWSSSLLWCFVRFSLFWCVLGLTISHAIWLPLPVLACHGYSPFGGYSAIVRFWKSFFIFIVP